MNKPTEPILQVAAKALLVNSKGKILILREAKTYVEGTNIGRYHGPGGRIKPSESYEEGLRREVEEETGITDIEPLYPIYVGDWRPVIKDVSHHIVGIFTLCKTKTSEVRLSSEHDDYRWIDPKDASKYDIMNPEAEVIAAYLSRRTA
jgi:8-oxo-dGTP diphosphatase